MKAASKKKPGKPKKLKELEQMPETPVDGMSEPVSQPEGEDMSEKEIEGMIERKEEKKVAAVKKVELSVDKQEWTKSDPMIPEELAGRVWVAVFKCPVGHKTKATNRQAQSGVQCYDCKGQGKEQKADIMLMFLNKPAQEDKRKTS